MIPRRSAAKGFSLLEVMVSIGVLAIGMVATFPMVSYTSQRAANARRESMAQAIAVELLENLRSETRFDALGATTVDLNGDGVNQFWRREVLPHDAVPLPLIPPVVANRQIASCVADNAGASDFLGENAIGPFWIAREGDLFAVCYSLRDLLTGNCLPGDSNNCQLQVMVKVLWRSPSGAVLARRVPGRISGS